MFILKLTENLWPSAVKSDRVEAFHGKDGNRQPRGWHREVRSEPKLGSAWGKRSKIVSPVQEDSLAKDGRDGASQEKKWSVDSPSNAANEVLKLDWDPTENGRFGDERGKELSTVLGDFQPMRGLNEGGYDALVINNYDPRATSKSDADDDEGIEPGNVDDVNGDSDVIDDVVARSVSLPANLAGENTGGAGYLLGRNEWPSPNPGERLSVWGRKRLIVPSLSLGPRWKFAGPCCQKYLI